MPPEESRQSLPDHSGSQPDLMAALAESLDRPTWVIHLAKRINPVSSRSEAWVGVAEDRDAANAAALAWVQDPAYYVSYADGPFVSVREHDRLRAENEALKATPDRDKARCQHCVPPPLADERSFMCEDCAGQADEDAQRGRDADAARGDLVDVLLDLLQDGEEFARTPLIIDRKTAGEKVLAVLDAERERTGADEWDESDHRCALYNLAWDYAEGAGAFDDSRLTEEN